MAISRLAALKDASPMPNSCFRLLANRWSSSLAKASSGSNSLPPFMLPSLSPENRIQSRFSLKTHMGIAENMPPTNPSDRFGLGSAQNRLEDLKKLIGKPERFVEQADLDEVVNAGKVLDEMPQPAENWNDGLYCMPTCNQMMRKPRKPKKRGSRSRNLDKCPQKAGVCVRVFTRSPKKPNSANRKLAKVRLSNGKDVFAYIPGEGHNLQEHSIVMIRGGRVPDLPGVKFHCIRGVKDLMGLPNRRQRRSLYGGPKPKPE